MASSRDELNTALRALTRTEKTYAKYPDGTVVRLGNVPVEEGKNFLKYRRAYTLDEILEELGVWWAKYMVTAGYAVHTGSGIFMVTTKAAETYNLPTRHHEGWNLKLITTERASKLNYPLPSHLRGRHHLENVRFAA